MPKQQSLRLFVSFSITPPYKFSLLWESFKLAETYSKNNQTKRKKEKQKTLKKENGFRPDSPEASSCNRPRDEAPKRNTSCEYTISRSSSFHTSPSTLRTLPLTLLHPPQKKIEPFLKIGTNSRWPDCLHRRWNLFGSPDSAAVAEIYELTHLLKFQHDYKGFNFDENRK